MDNTTIECRHCKGVTFLRHVRFGRRGSGNWVRIVRNNVTLYVCHTCDGVAVCEKEKAKLIYC